MSTLISLGVASCSPYDIDYRQDFRMCLIRLDGNYVPARDVMRANVKEGYVDQFRYGLDGSMIFSSANMPDYIRSYGEVTIQAPAFTPCCGSIRKARRAKWWSEKPGAPTELSI